MHATRPGLLTAAQLTDAYQSGELRPSDVADDVLKLAEVAGTEYQAIAWMNGDEARDQAAASDRRWEAGEPIGPLDGVPISIKESIPMRGTPWRHGSLVHPDVRGETDAIPVARLRAAGVILFAKTTMPELGMVASGVSSLYGVVRNPWNTDYTPGGSSSGAGALVAAGVGPIALGTDLGGSVRIPAAHCGVFGFKPTQGVIPYAPASSVRSVGALTRTVADLESVLSVISGYDRDDLSSLPASSYAPQPSSDASGLRVAFATSAGAGMPAGPDELAAAKAQADILRSLGAQVTEIPSLGLTETDQDALLATFRFRVVAEIHTRPLADRARLLPDLAEFVEPAYAMSGLSYAQAISQVEAARDRVGRVTQAYDIVITPALSVAAFRAEAFAPPGARSTIDHAQFTAWFNQTGQPAGIVPAGFTPEGLPIGAQVVGNRGDDARVIGVMRLLAEANDPLVPRLAAE